MTLYEERRAKLIEIKHVVKELIVLCEYESTEETWNTVKSVLDSKITELENISGEWFELNEKELNEKIKLEEEMILRTQNEIKRVEMRVEQLKREVQQRLGKIQAFQELMPKKEIKKEGKNAGNKS